MYDLLLKSQYIETPTPHYQGTSTGIDYIIQEVPEGYTMSLSIVGTCGAPPSPMQTEAFFNAIGYKPSSVLMHKEHNFLAYLFEKPTIQ